MVFDTFVWFSFPLLLSCSSWPSFALVMEPMESSIPVHSVEQELSGGGGNNCVRAVPVVGVQIFRLGSLSSGLALHLFHFNIFLHSRLNIHSSDFEVIEL